MTRYGLFNHGNAEPLQVYEGDCFASTPPYTTVIVYSTDGGSLREVALIHVADGQSVKEFGPRVPRDHQCDKSAYFYPKIVP